MELPKGLEITFIGHASFRVVTPEQKIIYIDAWLGQNPVAPEELKSVEKADLFVVTHGHGDHLDSDLIEIANRTGAKVVAPSAIVQYLKSKGFDKVEFMQNGGTIEVAGVKITMTQAYHAAHINTPEGPMYPHATVGYVIEFTPGFRVYFAGDTGIFGDMKLIGDMYHPQISALPIGDRATMGPLQASHAVRMLQSPVVIPFHFGTFPMLTGTPEELAELLKGDPVELKVMKPGDTWRGLD
jgi:L-ascorbate metabolism protein UlaG (beta-lactamase superfamily)